LSIYGCKAARFQAPDDLMIDQPNLPNCNQRASLVPECLNWIEAGGLSRRVVAEENSDGRREPDGDRHRRRRRRCRPAREMAEQRRAAVSKGQADDPAQKAHDDTLDEELG